MSTTLSFALTGSGAQLVACAEHLLTRGHTIVGVISDSPEVSSFASRRGIELCPVAGDQLGLLAQRPFDYLLSIVNHSILAPEVVRAPRLLAINYHDSPLPEYAGFNATSWAILEGRSSHGVTWHQMTTEVDAGQIFLQPRFDIGEDDTAFTLSVRCSEAGIAAFSQLVERLEHAAASGQPLAGSAQNAGRSFHLRSERPGLTVLDFRSEARALHRLVRALHFGPDDNWMSKPKLLLPGGFVAVTEATMLESQGQPAGTVLALDGSGLTVATSDGALRFGVLHTLAGEPLDAAALEATFQVREGSALAELAGQVEALREPTRELDARLTKHERFWVKQLRESHAPLLPGLGVARHADKRGSPGVQVLTRALPGALHETAAAERKVVLTAALAAFVTRTGEGGPFSLGIGVDESVLPRALYGLYARVTPLQVAGDSSSTFGALCEQTRSALAEHERRLSYARDAVLRYRALRELPSARLSLPIAVRFVRDGQPTGELLEGAVLTLEVYESAATYALVYDQAAISGEAAEQLASRFEVLLAGALARADAPVALLPLLPLAERELLVQRWQDTVVPYDARTVHELFSEQAARTPEQVALRFRDRTLSYRELDRQSNRVAQALQARGVGPEVLVGLCIERSLEMSVGLLGVLKAGGAYVPLDPVYPADRLAIMLEDSKAKVLLTQTSLAASLPSGEAEVLTIESLLADARYDGAQVSAGATPDNLAYVIFTSGSTGRPKGVMVLHQNAVNFFIGMDRALGHQQPGVWLAVTSISFDISVLELFWTLTRGFTVVIQEELDRASLAKSKSEFTATSTPMGFGLFYFAAETGEAPSQETRSTSGGAYRLLLEGARFADTHDFSAVWTPERHFHAFGGLYPNPAVTTAALATITQRVQLRAGSIVIPLHNPLRVAEDWAVIDHLSGGRIGLSFASGWHVNDFAFMPDNYARRRDVMLESIDTVQRLWRGEKVAVKNGNGEPIEVGVLPRPVNAKPPIWIASAGNVDTFQLAGRLGFNVLTNMLGQDMADLRTKLAAYREARRAAGHAGDGIVSVMLHTFVCEDTEQARELARRPFGNYLESSFDLVKVAPWMFPAFKQPSKSAAQDPSFDPSAFTPQDMRALLDHAFERYFETAGLFGSPEHALGMIEQLKAIGVNEVACLIDFGIDTDVTLQNLVHLDRLRQLSNPSQASLALPPDERFTIGAQLARGGITHLQCTPSMARMLLTDPEARLALGGLHKLMLGGEALPRDLVDELSGVVGGEILNMYGPTETTVWSTTSKVDKTGAPITIGRPIANTVIRILDAHMQLTPVGVPGELCIGGAGVVRGYLGRPDLTEERFVEDPCEPGARIYRTGDLARYRGDGEIEFLGRLDHQVKVNGYRIELGEIESVLTRHPSVRQSVVVARQEGTGPSRLVAYVIGNAQGEQADDGARVDQWKSLWDETYKLASAESEQVRTLPRFNIAGWRDSFSGEPIPSVDMREWLDATVGRIRALSPRRVLEIGCGTGMILYGVSPHVEHYSAVDVSPHALETIRKELSPAEQAKVTLFNQPAHAIEGIGKGSVDTVIINSVAQYFPDQGYLTEVLKKASELVVDGGHIFVGDVRNLAHLEAFHTWAELSQAPATRPAGELAQRIARRVRNEGELLLSETFFDALIGKLPRVRAVDVWLKRGSLHNEMSCFRFDVVLHVGSEPARSRPDVTPVRGVSSLGQVSALLDGGPPLLWLTDVPDARVVGVHAAVASLRAQTLLTAGELRTSVERAGAAAIEPEALFGLHPDYEVDVRQARSGEPSRFDAILRHKQHGPRGWPGFAALPAGPLANQPARAADTNTLSQELREHLRQALPEYMVPAKFVQLSAFPLTPNGKIDRKALPAPEASEARATVEFAPPSSDLEQKIAEAWQAVLNLERVGRSENIFDLGANSLLTVQAANRLSSALGRKVSLVSMFRFPSVEALAAHLGGDGEVVAEGAQKRKEEREDRKKDAAERRRQMRAERNPRSS
jgi:natural product biosynthesis luciferase-like monooxygenase protein